MTETVLNFRILFFRFVSDFDIRISHFFPFPPGVFIMQRPLSRRLVRYVNFAFLFAAVLAISSHAGVLQLFGNIVEYIAPIVWPQPPIIQPGTAGGPPSDAIVLFDGKDMSAFKDGEDWKVEDGCAIAARHDIDTKQAFGDCQVHVEWAPRRRSKAAARDAATAASFMMGLYEIQILDSYDNDTYYDGQAASVYKQHPPMVNACRKPGEWQTYDIIWEAPKFDKQGKLLKPAYVTVLHNGVLVQNHFELTGGTSYDREAALHGPSAPSCRLRLQFHGNPVRFRNIWVREIKDIVGKPGDHPHHPG